MSQVSRSLALTIIATLIAATLVLAMPASKAAAASRALANRGTTTLAIALAPGSGLAQEPEFPQDMEPGARPNPVNKKSHGFPPAPLAPPVVAGSAIAPTNADLVRTFQGLNHFDQRTANGGNQFSLEPPDQGLCVGNGYVLETVNDVLRVYSTTGVPLTGVVDLNSFYHYPAAINRGMPPGSARFGQFVTDPVCYFDNPTQRWFHVVLTLETVPTSGAFTLENHLDIAVSQTADPRGGWTLYSFDATDDGTKGSPTHKDCPCLGDFPHIGADANGIFLTTNEYSWDTPTFNGAQVYAFSKRRLAAGTAVNFIHLDNLTIVGTPAFTMWPAISPAGIYETKNDGTEYFLSSLAGDGSETGNPTGTDKRIGLWMATNTKHLDRDEPQVQIERTIVNSEIYVFPPLSDQKDGDHPQGQAMTPPRPVGKLDSSDTRFLTATFAGGLLWGALGTGVSVGGKVKAGIAWFVIKANAEDIGKSSIVNQGYLAVANNNVIYPAIAVTTAGKGIMAMTLVGADHHPSAAYAHIDQTGVGTIHVASPGRGTDDGFTQYRTRPRWGDYGMAVVDESTIWIASESIEQTCTLAQYRADSTCGGTRTSLANWATRISQVNP